MFFDYIVIEKYEELERYIDEILGLQSLCDNSLPDESWYIPSDREEFEDYINNGGIIVLAMYDTIVAGVMSSGIDNDHYEQAVKGGARMPSRKFLYLSLVCVGLTFRGNGIQAHLMEETMKIAYQVA